MTMRSQMDQSFCAVFGVIVILMKLSSAETDPCDPEVYGVLDDHRRDVSSKAATNLLCDLDLTLGWYRFFLNGSDAGIPTSCVQPNHCGTQAPIWLNLHSIPEVGQEVTSVACSSWSGQGREVNCCFYSYRASVKNCGLYLVYKLGSSLACNIAYCAQVVKFELSTASPTSTTATTSTTAAQVHTTTSSSSTSTQITETVTAATSATTLTPSAKINKAAKGSVTTLYTGDLEDSTRSISLASTTVTPPTGLPIDTSRSSTSSSSSTRTSSSSSSISSTSSSTRSDISSSSRSGTSSSSSSGTSSSTSSSTRSDISSSSSSSVSGTVGAAETLRDSVTVKESDDASPGWTLDERECPGSTKFDSTSQSCLGQAEITVEVEADDIVLNCDVIAGPSVRPRQGIPHVTWCEQVHLDSVMCQVEGISRAGGVIAFRSRPFFVGLQIKESQLAVSDNGTSSRLTLSSSIPVPCESGFESSYCKLDVNLLVFDTDGRYLPRLRFSSCHLELSSSQCNSSGCEDLPVDLAMFPDPQGMLSPKDVVLIAGITYTGPGVWTQTSVDKKVFVGLWGNAG
ncbi:von Willebrand factor D and EGF domain-containing protein [Elysia marginata]|uniref:von Willebrand factor D and EGF domain-containing protein n=1 Tax=Elysia marginata TaxID=1093978 RepID=A0AAV4GB34_9GAST|nr:von Willebrand factor D and EGF domain-containing protein [Elysia marginata]